jgi:hypothetical protein
MTRIAAHGVLSLELGRHVVPITWGNVTLAQDEPSPGVYGLKSWSLDAELAEFDFLDTIHYRVRAELDNGEVLEGRALLTNTNGWSVTLRSNGGWTAMAGW